MTTAPKTSSKLDTLFSGNVTPVNATVANVSPVSVQSLNPLQLSFMQRSKGEGRLGVGFKRNSTVVENLYQQGCAKIRLPKSYDQNAEAVMINSSGGITGGDALVWNFSAGAHSNLTITTQACERIYKSSTLDVSKDSTSHKNSEAQGGSKTDLQYGKIDVCLNVGSHACLSWLPQETILFDRGALKRTLEIHLEKSSKALICESFILGRKEMDEVVESGYIKDKWRVYCDEELVHGEDLKMEGDIQGLISRTDVSNKHIAFATVLSIDNQNEAKLAEIRKLLAANKNVNGGASLWQIGKNPLGFEKLIIRLTATDGYALRKTLLPILELLKMQADTKSDTQIQCSLPKVWSL